MSFFYNYDLARYMMVPERFFVLFNVLLIVLIFIVLLLKGLALWRSARLGQNVWFWIFMFVNTLGILEIVYLIAYSDGFKEIKPKEPKEKKEGKKLKFNLTRKTKKQDQKPVITENIVETQESSVKGEIKDAIESKNLDMNNWVS